MLKNTVLIRISIVLIITLFTSICIAKNAVDPVKATPEMLILSWDKFHEDAKALAAKLKEEGRSYDAIVAVARGGLPVAGVIGNELGIRLIDTICLKSYTGKEQTDIQILKNVSVKSDKILVIDDLVDTGKSMEVVRRLIPHAHVATLYAKPQGRKTADTFVKEVSQNTWIVFPWENYKIDAQMS